MVGTGASLVLVRTNLQAIGRRPDPCDQSARRRRTNLQERVHRIGIKPSLTLHNTAL